MIIEKLEESVVKELLFLKMKEDSNIVKPHWLVRREAPFTENLTLFTAEMLKELAIETDYSEFIRYLTRQAKDKCPKINRLLSYSLYVKYGLDCLALARKNVNYSFGLNSKEAPQTQKELTMDSYEINDDIKKYLRIYNCYTANTTLYHPKHLEVIKIFTQDKTSHVIIQGESGTGKTSIANFIGNDSSLFEGVFNVDNLDELSKNKSSRYLYVINDVDKLIINISDTKKLLDFLDTHYHIGVVLTTNHIDKLEAALLRAGRISNIVNIGELEKKDARALIYKTCKFSSSDNCLSKLLNNSHNYKLPKEVISTILELSYNKKSGLYSPCKLKTYTDTLLTELNALNLNNFLKIEEKALLEGLRLSQIPDFKVKEDDEITTDDINNLKLADASINNLLKKVSRMQSSKKPKFKNSILKLFKETLESVSKETSMYHYPDKK